MHGAYAAVVPPLRLSPAAQRCRDAGLVLLRQFAGILLIIIINVMQRDLSGAGNNSISSSPATGRQKPCDHDVG